MLLAVAIVWKDSKPSWAFLCAVS